MAWTTFLTLEPNKSYPVDFDFSRYRYRVYIEYTDSVYGISIRAFINGVYNAIVLSNLKSGQYADMPEMVGSRTYDITASESGSRGVTHLQREAKNTAPTTPGVFTQPAGILENGDARVISWGASTDAEGTPPTYLLELSKNGGAYTQILQQTQTNYTYTIPADATSLRFRVRAYDGTLYSAYRESGTYTVTKPTYYWSKYNATADRTYSYTIPENSTGRVYTGQNSITGQSNFTFNSSTGTFLSSGIASTLDFYSSGNTVYTASGSTLRRYRWGADALQGLTGIYYQQANVTSTLNGYSRGSLVQSGITAVEGTYPTNGRHSDGYWYVRGSRVNQSIAPTGPITTTKQGTVLVPDEVVQFTFAPSPAPNIARYDWYLRYNDTGDFNVQTNDISTSRGYRTTTDKTKTKVQFAVRAQNTSGVYSDYVYSEIYAIQHNAAPVVTLKSPASNITLYENDTLLINGTVQDADVGNTVTVRYQIGAGTVRAIKAFLSTGSLEDFGKTLTFKGGNLYDGDILIASDLADGVAQSLKVWATDDKDGISVIAERTFYVVPNRVPLLTVNTPIIEGNIDADLINIDGTFSEPDANNAIVSYRINGGNSVQIAEGTSGTFDFTVSFSQLITGDNIIVIEVIDSYGAKTSKTIKLHKKAIETPLLKSTQRYQLLPPSGSTVGVLFYIQREAALDMDVSISMTQEAEAEQYTTLKPVTTAPISQGSGIVEDEYYHAAPEPAEKILLQIDFTRTSLTANEKIYVVMGAFE